MSDTQVRGRYLGQNFFDDVTVDVREASVDAVVSDGKLFVVDAEQM